MGFAHHARIETTQNGMKTHTFAHKGEGQTNSVPAKDHGVLILG